MFERHEASTSTQSRGAGLNALARRFGWIACVVLAAGSASAATVGPGFTYQGQLQQNGAPYTGNANLAFSLWDALTGGTQIGTNQNLTGVSVTNGLFTVVLNGGNEFGPTPFDGNARWLQIGVTTGGPSVLLTPRQELTATPYAAFAPGPWQKNGSSVSYVNGNVGIGTASPGTKLHVDENSDNAAVIIIDSGASAANYSAIDFRDRNGLKWGLGKDPSNAFYIGDSYNPTYHFTILPNGNVGIGTNSPVARLDVNGITRTDVLQITGADLAEKFPASEPIAPGMVVAIDPNRPGHLCLARGAYNRNVAGVASGANDFEAGAVLGNLPGCENAPPVALSGRVYVRCDASQASIQPGDLLTTSDTPGHAMKAVDSSRAQGAVLGKAMAALKQGEGLVLVLVSLQ